MTTLISLLQGYLFLGKPVQTFWLTWNVGGKKICFLGNYYMIAFVDIDLKVA